VRSGRGKPSGTAKYSRVYTECQRNRTSENICGQYFAAPSRVVADLRAHRRSVAIAVVDRRDATLHRESSPLIDAYLERAESARPSTNDRT
jgi:hypothetical protein